MPNPRQSDARPRSAHSHEVLIHSSGVGPARRGGGRKRPPLRGGL